MINKKKKVNQPTALASAGPAAAPRGLSTVISCDRTCCTARRAPAVSSHLTSTAASLSTTLASISRARQASSLALRASSLASFDDNSKGDGRTWLKNDSGYPETIKHSDTQRVRGRPQGTSASLRVASPPHISGAAARPGCFSAAHCPVTRATVKYDCTMTGVISRPYSRVSFSELRPRFFLLRPNRLELE